MRNKILNVVGARPNFMKIAPIMAAMKKQSEIETTLLHTGQHYDETMSKLFFQDLDIPRPDIYLRVGSYNHGTQTGKVMIEFEKVLLKDKPDLVVVVGDVNSTIACGLVAVKLGIKLAHVEAGLRSFDRSMPEEINRILTDQISDFLFVTEKSGEENLIKEGIDMQKIFFVGNVMIDTLMNHLQKARASNVLHKLELKPVEYAAITLHRPGNVDSKEHILEIIEAFAEIQKHIKLVFPMHPRTRERLMQFGLREKLNEMPQLIITEPFGYLDFLQLVSQARFVLTDSGGIQEETTVMNIPCLTLRNNTERPVTVNQGTNLVVGSQKDRIIQESMQILKGRFKKGRRPDLWDGKAAERIVEVLVKNFSKG